MHKMRLNTLELEYTLRPNGPILIKSGIEEGADPTLPNMNFVRGAHPETGEQTIYLPGSSLKGVMRSHAERIARTVGARCCDPLGESACDMNPPFRDRPGGSVNNVPGPETYRALCTACRLFGDNVMASRFLVPDAYPAEAKATLPVRQMVAIDRRSGGSVNAFRMEVATSGDFRARLVLHNFERWQVGLLALVLRDIGKGRVGVGFGKSRGLGQVTLEYTRLTLSYPGLFGDSVPETLAACVYGVGELAPEDMIQEYGFMAGASGEADIPEVGHTVEADWGQVEVTVEGSAPITEVLKAQLGAWRDYVEHST